MKTLPHLLVFSFAVLAPVLSARTTPLLIEQTIEARFPPALALSNITNGEARVVVSIDPDGKLVDYLVTGYTGKCFADEAVTVIKAWHYTAPSENGRPIGVRTELRFNFESRGRVLSLTAIETSDVMLKQMGVGPAYIANVCRPHELDRPLAPVDAASPLYPASSRGATVTQPQSVVVDFYIDEQGQPRMPVVVNTAQEHYASAAVDALTRWKFATPTRAGRPVAVRVRQEFIFPGRS
jgi:outer membrane biosynthesis protein TonB